jgi:hypothetical protein
MSSPSWLRSTALAQRRHVRGRRSASTSNVRSRTIHTIAQGTRNELVVVIEVTTALSDATRPKLTLWMPLRVGALRCACESGVRCTARVRRRHSRHCRVASDLWCARCRSAGATRPCAAEVTAESRSHRPGRLRRERPAGPRQPAHHRGAGTSQVGRASERGRSSGRQSCSGGHRPRSPSSSSPGSPRR